MKKLVSIIIPVYNALEYIEICLNSLMNQSYENIEIILVDDGSTDGSSKVCDNIAHNDIRIHVIHKKNSGAGTARNVGLECAKGEYICFVDADDVVGYDYIEGLMHAIDANDLGICGFDNILTFSDNIEDYYNVEKLDQYSVFKRLFDTDESGEACNGYLWNKMFVKRIIDTINLRFESKYRMWEDMHFCCQYALKVKSAGYVKKSLYHYNDKNEESISHKVNSNVMMLWVDAADEIADLLKKHDLYEITKYGVVLSDLYMKALIINTYEDKKTDRSIVDFLELNTRLLRKKYKIYFEIYKICPDFFRKFRKIITI